MLAKLATILMSGPCPTILEERKKEGLLPEGWKQQDGAEVLLHLEGSRLSNTDRGDENASNIVGYIK